MKLGTIKQSGVLPIHLGGAAVCVGLLVAGWFAGLGPLLTETTEATSVLEQAEQVSDAARRSKEQLDALSARIADVRDQLSEQPVQLTSASEINPLLAQLANWADQDKLAVTRTQAGRRVTLPYYDYVPISIAGEGAYGDLLGFFHRLYADRSDLGVVSFNLSRLATSKGVSFEIELAWYVLSDGEDPAAAPTASVPTR